MDTKTFRTFTAEMQLKAAPDSRIVEGHAAVFNVLDSDGDVITPGAFQKSIKDRHGRGLVKMLWQHKDPLGRVLEIREDHKGLYIKARVARTRQGDDALALMQDGVVDRMSIGYDVVQSERVSADTLGLRKGGNVRVLSEIKLYEVSAVTFPANEEARIIAVKREDGTWESKMAMDSNGATIEVGSLCTWADGGAGQVTDVVTDGSTVGETEVIGTEDAPAALVTIFTQDEEGVYVATEEQVAALCADLTVVDSLGEAEAEADEDATDAEAETSEEEEKTAASVLVTNESSGGEVVCHTCSQPIPDATPKGIGSVKAGRIIAKRNLDRLGEAVSLIQQVVSEEGSRTPQTGDSPKSANRLTCTTHKDASNIASNLRAIVQSLKETAQ